MKHFQTIGSHYEIGFSIGQRFSDEICRAMVENPTLQYEFLPFHKSPEGQKLFRQLISLHRKSYPDYISEIKGIAEGSGRPFEEIFLINMRGEYRSYTKSSTGRGCSTVSVVTDEYAAFGHNEDGLALFKDGIYVVDVHLPDRPSFTAFSYPGFLCGNAFGFNSEGICFCNNDVQPSNIEVGVGRHFISRSLLESQSIEDAIDRITPPDRAAGFNYTIGSVKQRRIVNVEVSPRQHIVTEIKGTDFRANHYIDLNGIEQIIGPSSRLRVKRATSLINGMDTFSNSDILTVLTDQQNPEYPIFRTAQPPDDIATLVTCVFDLDTKQLAIYYGHPIKEEEKCSPYSMR